MKMFACLSGILMLASSISANVEARILRLSDMDVTDARYDFEGIANATITVLSDNGTAPSTLMLQYTNNSVILPITNTRADENGCMSFYAGMSDLSGVRFQISLQSDLGCEGTRMWNAHVRQGYGWCGTMDSTMDLVGLPHN